MRFRLGSSIRRVVALAAALALTAGIGVATGAIPSSSGKIYGCFTKDGGRLRVIDKAAGQKCQSAEKTLNWNQQGPKGDPGPQGPKGAPGVGTLKQRSASTTVAPGQTRQVDAVCQPGERATGGGFFIDDENVHVLVSASDLDLTKWSVEAVNRTGQPQVVAVQVVCAS